MAAASLPAGPACGRGTAPFRPRMETRIHALRTLQPLACRNLPGAVADVWRVRGEQGGGGYYIAPDPRLVVFLDAAPPAQSVRTAPDQPERMAPRAMFIPAGVPLWSRLGQGQEMSHVDFHMEAETLQNRLAAAGMHQLPQTALFSTDNDMLLSLARLAAGEIDAPRQGAMVLDGFLQSLLGMLLDAPAEEAAPARGGLAPAQIRAVEKHLRANLTRQVPVAELAEVAGLSESWFARAFKASRGETPQRWQMQLRLEAAREMMRDTTLPLAEIALSAGFSDQAHLSRQFRASHGMTPSAWRKMLPRAGTFAAA